MVANDDENVLHSVRSEPPTPAVDAAVPEAAKPLPSPFYEDGYTRIVVIPSELTGFAPVKLVYRPIVADEHELAKAWGRLNVDKPLIDHYAPLLATKIIDWDIKSQSGGRIKPTAENIRRVSPSFYPVLLDVVSGYTSLSDIEGNPGPTIKNS
jgi:hypothetical protein